MTEPLRILSSMATKRLLADLLAAWLPADGAVAYALESVGGVDAAKRVQAGEPVDIVVLASDAIERLSASGHLVPGSRVGVARSAVAVAVPAGTPRPDIGSEAALKLAVLKASSIGYSTGPSGVALAALFARWGIAGEVAARLLQAPPGVPVGTLLARGEVALGFQQFSELMDVAGIDVVGTLPAAAQIETVFAAAQAVASRRAPDAAAALAWLAAPSTGALKRAAGMAPV